MGISRPSRVIQIMIMNSTIGQLDTHDKIVPISKDPMWNNSETSVKLGTNI